MTEYLDISKSEARYRHSNKILREQMKEMEIDGIEQRKLIERLTRLVKDFRPLLPDQFIVNAFVIINEYERRFTLISDNDKAEHPVFRNKPDKA